MNKLLSVLVAALFTAGTFSAVAADTAMAPAKPAAAPAAKTAPAAPKKVTAQQAKMKRCNMEAKEKDLHKAERKAFMKSCLKKEKKDSAAPSAE
ncbi:MAG: PsiF family protein [Gallionella sp.]|nr:PsiF family protein [Gallionella sp.]